MVSRWCILVIWLLLLLAMNTIHAQNGYMADRKFQAWLAKRPYISEIHIEGNSFIKTDDIRESLHARVHSFWQTLRGGSQDRVMRYTAYRDTLAVKYMYIREGFINVRVNESYEIAVKDSSAIVTVLIEEGDRYLIGDVKLEANEYLPFHDRLRHLVRGLKRQEAVDLIRLNKMAFDMKTVFSNNGYPYAQVSADIDSSSVPVATGITFRAQEGPLVRFGQLQIQNLKKYPEYVVRREITFKPGEIYSRKKIQDSQKRLYSTNLFNSINLKVKQDSGSVPGQVLPPDTLPDFVFSGISRKPHAVSAKTGASQDNQQDLIWSLSSTWEKRNLFGSRYFELLLQTEYIIFTQWRPLSHRFQFRYREPWFLGLRLPMILTAWYEPGVRSQIQPSRIQRYSVDLSTTKEWSASLYGTLGFQYENVNIYGVDEDEILAIRDTIRVRRKLTATLVRDSRRDKFIPISGSYTTYYAQYVGGPLGGDDSFIKLEWSWARYQRALGFAVFATRLKTGWVKEFGDAHSVPTDDRFFLGGANSIRGFGENSIGPRDEEGTNVGANTYLIFNQELRFPLFWKFWGSVFTDLGNGWGSFSDANFDSLLFSYGGGLQFISPAGPIRLDYGHRLESGGYSEGDRWHITILYAF